MNLVRHLFTTAICLSVQLSACLQSSTFVDTSLWGKKLQFHLRPCLWHLHPQVTIPPLTELSVCVVLQRLYSTEWTGFDYNVPGNSLTELGLGGVGSQLRVRLFGKEENLAVKMPVNEWHSLCITWSSQAQRLRLYINGTQQLEAFVESNQLAANGTLTLGVPHFVAENGEIHAETGKTLYGEIGFFGVWSKEWSAEELERLRCTDGDVVGWDLQQWESRCVAEPDDSLHCVWSTYKVKMWTLIHITELGNCSVSLEEVTRNWLQSVFPPNIYIHDVFVSSSSRACHNSAAAHVQQPQESRTSNSTCDKCFSCEVYVNVDPAADVEVLQGNITALLNRTFYYDFLNLRADSESISVQPVDSFPTKSPPTVTEVTELPPTVTSSERKSTQSPPSHSSNTSTTEEPLDLNETAVEPDIFFRVNVTMSMIGSPSKPEEVIEKRVKDGLQVNTSIVVLNLIVKESTNRILAPYNGQNIFNSEHKQYECAFHVQEYNIHSVADTTAFIRAALTSIYTHDSVTIKTTHLDIKHIEPKNCLEELTSTIYGQYFWPTAFPQVTQEMGCSKPTSEKAFRLCKLDIENDSTKWADPNMTNCTPLLTISDIENTTVTTDNAAEVVDMIQDLVDVQLGNTSELSSSDLHTVMGKLDEVVDIGAIRPPLVGNIVDIFAEIILSNTNITPVANMLLNLTSAMGDTMDFQGQSMTLTAPSLALSVSNVDSQQFSGLTFGVSLSTDLNPKVFIDQSFVSDALPDTDATISLPSELNNFFNPGERDTTRVQFQFYGTQELFQEPHTVNATQVNWTLNSYIVSASINNSHVYNLKDQVVVNFRHQQPKKPDEEVQCVFWDFQKNGGQGGWNSRGCKTTATSANQTRCLCDHLTHFAVLLDVSRGGAGKTDTYILTVISYVGCGISSIFLGITLLTYLAFEKLRQDHPSKILINLSSALLGSTMLFLLNPWLSSFSDYGLCIATAAALHYFLLASFTWMGLEAVHMYFALVKVFNIYIPSYILKFCAVGWGVPLVIVSLVLAIDKDAYSSGSTDDAAVSLQSVDQFCWLQDDVFFFTTWVAFVLLILLCNLSVFVVVLIQIKRMRINKASTSSGGGILSDVRAVASLTVLLGLTWSTGFFSFGPGKVVMMYLFCIFNTMQGFCVFFFHCLMKENVRKQWRIHLCCGRFRLSDYSDWSRSVTGGVKKNNLVNCDSDAFDNTSTIRKVSDSSSSEAHAHQQGT